MPQGRDRWIAIGVTVAAVLVVAVLALIAGASADSHDRANSAPAAPAQAGSHGGKTFTIHVSNGGRGAYVGDIGVTDAAGLYSSQSVSGSYTGDWTVSGRSVTVTFQRQGDLIGTLQVTINGQSQQTNAPFGVVTLTAR